MPLVLTVDRPTDCVDDMPVDRPTDCVDEKTLVLPVDRPTDC